MNAKEYLSQARLLDRQIDSKIQQIEELNRLTTNCTATLTGIPGAPRRGGSVMADAVDRIVDLEREINRDIDRLVDLKREIMAAIRTVDNGKYQMVLEKRYLCYRTWEQIAADTGYNVRHLYRIHGEALRHHRIMPPQIIHER
jgi:prefoldin subunit 5